MVGAGAAPLTEEERLVLRLNNHLAEWCGIDEGREPWNYNTEDLQASWNGVQVGIPVVTVKETLSQIHIITTIQLFEEIQLF